MQTPRSAPPTTPTAAPSTGGRAPTSSAIGHAAGGLPTIRQGSMGMYVSYCQNLLNARLHLPIPLWVDGIFGNLTDAAVRQFQMRRFLEVDGVVGPQTWAALEAGPPPIRKRPSAPLVVPPTAGA